MEFQNARPPEKADRTQKCIFVCSQSVPVLCKERFRLYFYFVDGNMLFATQDEKYSVS